MLQLRRHLAAFWGEFGAVSRRTLIFCLWHSNAQPLGMTDLGALHRAECVFAASILWPENVSRRRNPWQLPFVRI